MSDPSTDPDTAPASAAGDRRASEARARPARPPALLRDALADAARFFTRAPVPAGWGGGGFDGIAAAAPLAGALIGAGTAATLALALAIGLPPLPASAFATAAGVAFSGALHLDGLADVADGFGGGRDRNAKLAIMRDSRLGTYGGAAIALALIARVTLAAALVERLGAEGAACALVAGAALARPLAFLPTLSLDPARTDGLGRGASPKAASVGLGVGLAAIAALLLGGMAAGLAAIALSCAAAAAVTALAGRQIGGHTGDVCGAAAEIAEIAALVGLIVAASPA